MAGGKGSFCSTNGLFYIGPTQEYYGDIGRSILEEFETAKAVLIRAGRDPGGKGG